MYIVHCTIGHVPYIFIEINVPVSFLVAVEVRVLGTLLGAGPPEPAHARDVILQKLYIKKAFARSSIHLQKLIASCACTRCYITAVSS
jgi:hypothetical protein